ncbi:MAG: CHAT domain-containing protein [Armatimonadota bacterium]
MRKQAIACADVNPTGTSQLAIDLIFYTWVTHRASYPEVSIPNAESIVSTLAKVLSEPAINWVIDYFQTTGVTNEDNSQLPPKDDPRIKDLTNLKIEFESAMSYSKPFRLDTIRSLENALQTCKRLSLDLSEALLLKILGDTYFYNLEQFRSAESCYERAAWIFAIYGCRVALALTHQDWGVLSLRTAKYTSASQHYIEAARQWEQVFKSRPFAAGNCLELAGNAYLQAGEALMAIGDVTTAMQLMRVKGLSCLRNWSELKKSYASLIKGLFRLAEIRRDLGDPADSLNILRQAQKACEQEGNIMLTVRLYEELEKTYAALNQKANQIAARNKRFGALIEAASKGSAASQELLRETGVSQKIADPNLILLAEQGALACQALGDYAQAAELWLRQAEYFKRAGQIEEQLRCMRAMASALESDEQQDKALEVRRDAVLLARKVKQSKVAADIVNDIIKSFISRKDITNALEGFTELVPILEETGNTRGAARVLESRAALLSENGKLEASIADYKLAMKKYIDQVGDIWSGARVALALSQIQRQANQLNDACDTLENAIILAEAFYGPNGKNKDSSAERSEILIRLYKDLARSYVQSGKPELATSLFTKARKYTWFSRIVSDLANDATDPTVAEWARTIELAPLESLPPKPDDPIGTVSSKDWGEYAQVCWWLESQYPREYASLSVDPIQLIRLRSKLPTNVALIQHLVTDPSVYIFVCTNDIVLCRRVTANRATLEEEVNRLRKTLINCENNLSAGIPVPPLSDWQEPSFVEIRRPLAELYSLLIAPISNVLQDKTLLIFALPNELHGVPMHSLVCTEENGRPVFLIERYEISYIGRGMLDLAISSSDNQAIDPKSDWVWIFADPDGNLPGAREEARKVKDAYMWSRWFVGPEKANATNFLNAIRQGGIIHLAAHHRIDANPSDIQLTLAPDAKSNGNVGIQELSRIESTRLKLVVFSACETLGSLDPISSGPTKVAELFTMIGAQSVIGGLWKVSDEAASEAMSTFYRELSRRKRRTESLRLAMQKMIQSKRYAHPFYWACFALYGNPN